MIAVTHIVRRADVADLIAWWMRGAATTKTTECAIARLGYTLDEARAAMAYVKGGGA